MKIYKIARKSSIEVLKENRFPLEDDERAICMREKAVWHHGPNGEESPAVWKSKGPKGEIIYVTNTHRAYQTDSTLEGCIKKFHDFIKDTASVQDQLVKTAVADGEFRDWKEKVNVLKDDIRDLKKDDKDFESRIKKIEKIIDDLNIGNRRFWQMTNVFTSLQRKIERFDVLEQEWKKFKEEIDDEVRKIIEKKIKAQIK